MPHLMHLFVAIGGGAGVLLPRLDSAAAITAIKIMARMRMTVVWPPGICSHMEGGGAGGV